jgi:hypothetical protein
MTTCREYAGWPQKGNSASVSNFVKGFHPGKILTGKPLAPGKATAIMASMQIIHQTRMTWLPLPHAVDPPDIIEVPSGSRTSTNCPSRT